MTRPPNDALFMALAFVLGGIAGPFIVAGLFWASGKVALLAGYGS